MTENPAAHALRSVKTRARQYLNDNHPETAVRLRDRLLTFARLRQIERRFEALERAVYSGVTADQSIRSWESKIFSQNGEDGILLNLFSRIGSTNRRFMEFGCGPGFECNSANLSLGFGWSGLLIDGDEKHIEKARTFYADRLGDEATRVDLRCAMVGTENINQLLADASPDGADLDLLSIDVDSVDYWIWSAIEGFKPRVVVCEYNASFGPTRSVTVSDTDGFDPVTRHPSGFYHGASLAALAKLADGKGYQLIGCDSAGVNAFFVRRDCAHGLSDLAAQDAYVENSWRPTPRGHEAQFRLIEHLPLTEV